MSAANLLTEWARLLVESLADAGLTEVVVSPGSRSTPFTSAFLSCRRIRCESIVDERAAAFYALGIARITGRPAAVLCTSGSAAANYFPAVVEASLSRSPLLVLTADRPFELQDCGAPQTIDQTRLYGEYVRRFADLGMPDGADIALVGLRRRAIQSLFETLGAAPGPVHLNIRARKPLEPTRAMSSDELDLARRVDALLREPATRAVPPLCVPTDPALAPALQDCAREERGIIVCGPAPFGGAARSERVAALARATGYPVYAEATSQLRFDGASLSRELVLDGLDVLLRSPTFRERFHPRVVLQLGEPPTSGAWERWLGGHRDVARHVISTHGWPDPLGSARSIVHGDVGTTLERLVASLTPSRSTRAAGTWSRVLSQVNEAAWEAVTRVVESEPALSEGAAARTVVEALPEASVFVVGNSLPVRHVDCFCRAHPSARLGVCSQRGASGIDGLVAGAAGSARAAGRPTVLLLGDVSALHDLGGFAAATPIDVPFVVVILNNDGGRIFEQLPLADAGEPEFRFWTTPHGRHFDGVAALFGLAYARATTVASLEDALAKALARPACTIVELVVPPQGARAQAARVASAVDAAVRPVLESEAFP